MIFTETAIAGVWMVDIEPVADARGFFARTFDREAFAVRGLTTTWAQCSVASNTRRGTVRGLHYQRPPHGESKLVRCTRGSVHDVSVDLREGSPTFGRHVAVVLSAATYRSLYVPPGVAHGYQTLTDDAEVVYQIDPEYVRAASTGVRFDDPALGIVWPLPVTRICARDLCYADVLLPAANDAGVR